MSSPAAAAAAPRRSARNAAKPAPPAPAPAPKKRAAAASDKPEPLAKKAKATAKAITSKVTAELYKEGGALPAGLPEVTTQAGAPTTLQQLLDDSKNGIVVFSYPKASTPGCTTQACVFSDNLSFFAEAGYAVYGVSADTPAANKKFKSKKSLGMTLISDPAYAIHGKKRSVLVVGKDGVVRRFENAGPEATLKIAKEAVGGEGGEGGAEEKKEVAAGEE